MGAILCALFFQVFPGTGFSSCFLFKFRFCFCRGGLYPSINPSAHNLSDPQLSLSARSEAPVNALTIRAGDIRKNIKDIPFKLHPLIESNCAGNRVGFFTFLLLSGSVTTLMFTFNFQENFLPEIKSYTRDMLDNLYRYEFTIERDAVRN